MKLSTAINIWQWLNNSPQQIFIQEFWKNHKRRRVTRNLSAARQPAQNVCGGMWQECLQQAEQVCDI